MPVKPSPSEPVKNAPTPVVIHAQKSIDEAAHKKESSDASVLDDLLADLNQPSKPKPSSTSDIAVFYISIIYTNILIRTVSSLPKPRPVSVPSHQESDRDSIPPRQAPVDPAKPEVHHISGLSRVESETVQEAAEIPQATVTPGTDAVHAPTIATATQSVTSAIASDLNVAPAPTAEHEINNSTFSSPVIVELWPTP